MSMKAVVLNSQADADQFAKDSQELHLRNLRRSCSEIAIFYGGQEKKLSPQQAESLAIELYDFVSEPGAWAEGRLNLAIMLSGRYADRLDTETYIQLLRGWTVSILDQISDEELQHHG